MMKIFLFFLLLTTGSFAKEIKNILFIVHTETINGKGVLDFYSEFKKRGHRVKVVGIPLLVKDNQQDKILYDLDSKFLEKFEKDDVIFPCGEKSPYTKCDNLPEDYKADIVFVQNPYNSFKGTLLDPFFTLEGLKKRNKKLAYVVYGPHLFHQDTCNDKNLKNLVDLVFVDSKSTKELFINNMGFDPDHVVVSGYQGYKLMRDILKNKRKKGKKTILYMPRWTLHFRYRDQHEGGSTFLSYYKFFLTYAKTNPDTTLLIRPHVALFKHAVDAGFLTQKEVTEIKEQFKSLPNVQWSEHIERPLHLDILPADIIVGEASSALGEVVVANKPIIYLSNGLNKEFESNELAKELRKFVYFAHDPNEIVDQIKLIKKHKYAPVQKKLAPDYELFKKDLDPVENPAKFIADFVEKM